jgi:hypothetical protein
MLAYMAAAVASAPAVIGGNVSNTEPSPIFAECVEGPPLGASPELALARRKSHSAGRFFFSGVKRGCANRITIVSRVHLFILTIHDN